MSLDYDLRKIPVETRTVIARTDEPSHGIKAGDVLMSPITNALIWSTISVGIGEINEKTVDEFWSRLQLIEKLYGKSVYEYDHDTDKWTQRALTRDDVVAHMGLSTNVFPMESRAKFVAKHTTKNRDFFPHAEPKGR